MALSRARLPVPARLALAAGALASFGACSRPPEPPESPSPPAAAAVPAPARARREVVLFLGDSLTAGYGVALEDAFPALLEARWRASGLPWKARNAGVSGATTAGVLETLEWSLSDDVALAFVCVGANDGLRGLDLAASRRNLEAIVARAKATGATVVMAGMKLPPNYGPDYTRRFEAMYAAVARAQGIRLLPFLLEGVAGRKELNIADGIHPNEAGHAKLAETVRVFLDKEGLPRGVPAGASR